jgi:hypothetical protein
MPASARRSVYRMLTYWADSNDRRNGDIGFMPTNGQALRPASSSREFSVVAH